MAPGIIGSKCMKKLWGKNKEIEKRISGETRREIKQF